MRVTSERRVAPESDFAEKLAWPLRLSRANAWRMVFIGGWLTVTADFGTGSEIWLGPVYLIIICFATWSLGWVEAIGFSFASLGITLAANNFELYPYPGTAGAWNIALCILAVLVLISMLHTVRQMYAREWRLSRTDLLTGALNRKAFFELTSGRTSSRGWSMLIYADMDGFKALNDTLGHTEGDKCLASFARQVTNAIRKDDVFARIGGDEFAIYLDVKDEAAAKAVAVRLHKTMNATKLSDSTSVKCSVGALILAPGARSIDKEVHGADLLMYEAKGLRSSLVVGTASSDLPILRHWELTPEGASFDDLDQREMAGDHFRLRGPASSAVSELQKVA